MDLNLAGKVAIVTGAARGIGRAIALTLSREGVNVVIDDIDLEAAQLVEEEAKASGTQAMAIRADVTKIDEVRQLVKQTLDRFGRIDILVNNAGILYNEDGKGWPQPTSFQDSLEEDWPKSLNVTLYGMLNCTKSVLKTMVDQKSGNIISISSYVATAPRGPHAGLYGAGKGGINSFSRGLAFELGPLGIRVNCISPGIIKTTKLEAIEAENLPGVQWTDFQRNMSEMIKTVPIGRIGTPQDVANVVVFLASDVSSYVNGQNINVTGGA